MYYITNFQGGIIEYLPDNTNKIINIMANKDNLDRGTAHLTVPKSGVTRRRRRLELGGKYEN